MVGDTTTRAEIRVGTSGWSFKDWQGTVYPEPRERGFSELKFLAQFLDSTEINTSFYRPPSPAYCEKWVRDVRANSRFIFTAKLWQRFTHETEKGIEPEDVRIFRNAIAPLVEAKKLGALLVQFPWAYARTPSNEDRLWRIREAFGDVPLIVEVRNISWLDGSVEESLRTHGMGFCNIDQPVSRQSIGPTNIATTDVAYYRLHGRNREKWFDRNAGRDERYNYLYSEDELGPWLKRIAETADKVEQVFVMANNHYKGQAFANALQMKADIEARPVLAPEALIKHYPILRGSTRAARMGPSSIFDR